MGFIWVDDKEDDDKFKSHMETKIGEATTSLTNSNDGLKADITKLKKKVKEKEDIDIEEVNKLKTENKALKEKKEGEETDVQKQLRVMKEQMEEERKKNAKTIEFLDNHNKTLLVDDEITKSLLAAKVKDSLMNAARLIIKADVSIVEEEGKRVARIGDKTVAEHVAAWAETDEGKNFILAPKNGGGGGGQGSGDGNPDLIESYFDPKSKNYNVTQQVLLKKTNEVKYNELKAKYRK